MPPQKSCSACAHPAAREVGLCRARADKQTQRVQERVVLCRSVLCCTLDNFPILSVSGPGKLLNHPQPDS